MTETATSRRIGDRTLYTGLWALGFVLYTGLIVGGYPIVGVVGFAVCGVAALAFVRSRDRVVFDERDDEVLRSASSNTMRLLGTGSAVVFPSMVVLDALGLASWPAWLAHLGYFTLALWGVWLAFLAVARVRR